jgi:multidrug efflux pump subunit AcrA (membrane-fusion protein)
MTPHPATIALRLAALIFLVASCYPVRILAADAPAAPPAVTVSQPIQRELVERDEFTGQFAAKEYVEIRARVSGYLTEIHFEDGQIVKEGDLLFVIDPRPYEATLAAATWRPNSSAVPPSCARRISSRRATTTSASRTSRSRRPQPNLPRRRSARPSSMSGSPGSPRRSPGASAIIR